MINRHEARVAALQILYFWEVGGVTPEQAIGAYFREHQPEMAEPMRAFATTLARGTAEDVSALDRDIAPHLKNWRLERMATIDRLIVRLGLWELRHVPETPQAVVIDEAVELAREFSGEEAAKFVNGVLDSAK